MGQIRASGLPSQLSRAVSRAFLHSIIFEQGIGMKYILILSILALLGGCIITPAGHGDNRDGYYHEGGYDRGDVYSRDYNYRGYQGNPYRDHGG
jgi:hypothetical protein